MAGKKIRYYSRDEEKCAVSDQDEDVRADIVGWEGAKWGWSSLSRSYPAMV